MFRCFGREWAYAFVFRCVWCPCVSDFINCTCRNNASSTCLLFSDVRALHLATRSVLYIFSLLTILHSFVNEHVENISVSHKRKVTSSDMEAEKSTPEAEAEKQKVHLNASELEREVSVPMAGIFVSCWII